LADPGPTILPGFEPELIELATKHLKNNGIELFTGVGVSECNENGVILKDGTVINAGTVVWAAGVRGNSVIDHSGFEAMRGRVKVDSYLKAPGFDNIFIIGDCALFFNEETERPYPPTAQIAMQMGAYLGKILVSILHKNNEIKPFKPSIKGTVASLGKKYAVGVVFGVKIKGWTAVMMKKLLI
jgi:NADH:ubiquinone reductase (H+-translocating)